MTTRRQPSNALLAVSITGCLLAAATPKRAAAETQPDKNNAILLDLGIGLGELQNESDAFVSLGYQRALSRHIEVGVVAHLDNTLKGGPTIRLRQPMGSRWSVFAQVSGLMGSRRYNVDSNFISAGDPEDEVKHDFALIGGARLGFERVASDGWVFQMGMYGRASLYNSECKAVNAGNGTGDPCRKTSDGYEPVGLGITIGTGRRGACCCTGSCSGTG